MTDFKRSAVVFDEASHTYRLGDDYLSGITSLIHSVLRLGVYPDASPYVRQVQIPKAGYYGTCVHQAIRTYDELGIAMTEFPSKVTETRDFGMIQLDAQDVGADLDCYRRMKPKGWRTAASEFTVSYGRYASQVDSVWEDDEGGIWLVDFKTNNLDYYPGGADGLKEYLSWQLSCYAVMFEIQTGRAVHGLLGQWLRKGAGELWGIKRQSDDDVLRLLSTEAVPNPGYDPADRDSQRFLYVNEEMQVRDALPAIPEGGPVVVPSEVTKAIADLLRAERAAKEMKERLRSIMEAAGVTKWECDDFTVTIGKDSASKSLDGTRLKNENPDLYEKYVKEVKKKGSFTIKAK